MTDDHNDDPLFNEALRTLLLDLFTGILYCNKVTPDGITLLEAAAGTLFYFMNNNGKEILRGVVATLNDKKIPEDRLN